MKKPRSSFFATPSDQPAQKGATAGVAPQGKHTPAERNDPHQTIDAHALATPPAEARSIEKLAAHLAAAANAEREKARAIFRWIAANITYGMGNKGTGNGPPEEVLRMRFGYCGGIAGLFEALARAMGLEVVTIPGHAKGRGYTPGTPLRGVPDHAWNAVRIDGQWELIDATWGGGFYVGEEYRKRFEPHYFCTPPQQFIHDHFPVDPQWQLLKIPKNEAAFIFPPLLKPDFFRAGLALGGHPEGVIHCPAFLSLGLVRPDEVLLHGELWARNQALNPALVFIQHAPGTVTFQVRLPRPGVYSFRIFARPGAQEGGFPWAMEYRLETRVGFHGKPHFPKQYADYAGRGAVLETPIEGSLSCRQPHRFRITVPGAREVALIQGERWEHLELLPPEPPPMGLPQAKPPPPGFQGDIQPPRGQSFLAASFEEGGKFHTLLEYTGF